MSKGFWGVIILVVLLFVGIFTFTGNKADAPSKDSSGAGKPTSHIKGKGESGVKLVEYGDYQCPFCAKAFPAVEQAVADLNDQIYFQFRNYPLPNLHRNAFAAARAAEAADMQGKFWEMYGALYQSQPQWSESDGVSTFFNQLAKQLGLDVDKFKKDYASRAVNNRINADKAEGEKLGVQGTPAFFLDGKKVDLPYSSGAEAVKKVLQQAIDGKTAGKPAGD
ncbi:MAG TPA: thioredoxin domain-containing protein [Candidatus Saccharimonadales bacterium]|nr:thioredoxin domain-containing protein [Candidatus Saccharimonadales bacterium]